MKLIAIDARKKLYAIVREKPGAVGDRRRLRAAQRVNTIRAQTIEKYEAALAIYSAGVFDCRKWRKSSSRASNPRISCGF